MMFFKRNTRTNNPIAALDSLFLRNSMATVEVDSKTAALMGAFEETAVSLDDFYHLEPGVLEDFFGPPPAKD